MSDKLNCNVQSYFAVFVDKYLKLAISKYFTSSDFHGSPYRDVESRIRSKPKPTKTRQEKIKNVILNNCFIFSNNL